MKTVAIALATYNGEQYIREQLDSLLDQSYANFCCYIHDDGSSDGTVEIVDSYCSLYPDRFVRLEYPSMHGAIGNFMSLLERIDEPYIMLCDQDDVWDRDKIQYSLEYMRRLETEDGSDRPMLVYCDLEVVDQYLHTIAASFYQYTGLSPYKTSLRDLFVQNCVPGCTMMINRSLRDYAIKVTDTKNISMHDVWLMLIATCAGRIGYIDKPLIRYRQHGDNYTGAHESGLTNKIKQILFEHLIRNTAQGLRVRRKTIIQLGAIDLPGLSDADKAFIEGIARVDHEHKVNRMIYYRNNRLYNWSGIMAILLC